MRVLTLNALFKGDVRARLRALAGVLDRDGYDIVCLQEVMYRANAALLPGRYRALSGAMLLSGGLVTLSRWPIRRASFRRYPALRPLRPELLMRKGVQVVHVDTPAGGLVVVNTHLSANRDDDWTPGNRYTRIERAELDTLAALIADLDPALPLLVTGDFNVPRGTAMLADFAATAGLRDVLAGDTEPTYRPTPKWPTPPALDQVYVRPDLGATARLVLRDAVPLPGGRQAYLSDHFGIETVLS